MRIEDNGGSRVRTLNGRGEYRPAFEEQREGVATGSWQVLVPVRYYMEFSVAKLGIYRSSRSFSEHEEGTGCQPRISTKPSSTRMAVPPSTIIPRPPSTEKINQNKRNKAKTFTKTLFSRFIRPRASTAE